MNKQKGFAPIMLLVIVIVLVVGGGVFWYQDVKKDLEQGQYSPQSEFPSGLESIPINKNGDTSNSQSCGLSGKIILPEGSEYKANELIISYGLFIETFADESGDFCISEEEINKQKDDGFLKILTKISVMIPETGE